MADLAVQGAAGPKPGRKEGDGGKKKVHASVSNEVATHDAFKDAAAQVRKLLLLAERNNQETSGTFKTSWSFTMTVDGGEGKSKVHRAAGLEGPGRGAAALAEPTREAVAVVAGADPGEIAELWRHAQTIRGGASSGEYLVRGAGPTKFTVLRSAEDAVRYFDDEKHVRPRYASVKEKDVSSEQNLGQEGDVGNQFPASGSPEKAPPRRHAPHQGQAGAGGGRGESGGGGQAPWRGCWWRGEAGRQGLRRCTRCAHASLANASVAQGWWRAKRCRRAWQGRERVRGDAVQRILPLLTHAQALEEFVRPKHLGS